MRSTTSFARLLPGVNGARSGRDTHTKEMRKMAAPTNMQDRQVTSVIGTQQMRPTAPGDTVAGRIRDAFNARCSTTSGKYSWWAREVHFDPPIVVADDDRGGLWRVDYSGGPDIPAFGLDGAQRVEMGATASRLKPRSVIACMAARPKGHTAAVKTRDAARAAAAKAKAPPRAAAVPRVATRAAAPSVSAHLKRDEAGVLSYAGSPVSMGSDGAPRVFTFDGWQSVASFEASGGKPVDLAAALDLVRSVPEGRTAKLYEAAA